ncbi:hypothetical protein RHMOL_Rhmol11G0050300 [Rhododendron molle]|uniref:Uncharacterized protein n=1 Tax=Rhododendron molle TaxID=49168 RepID=A0ACC0LNY1_RHOML|nr:hypothetical protein RHMOL_Rhmol11G0050300 [Rhododendron molle]
MEAVVEYVERFYPKDVDIHTKKRNRLDATRMNNLVYVQFNAKLINKKARKKEKDVLLASEATNAQGWIVVLKHPTPNQLAKSGEAAQDHILVLEEIINRCGTNSNTPPHVRPLTRTWRGKQRIRNTRITMK